MQKKTKLLLSRTKTLFDLQINIDDEAIERVKEIKYLGVTIDEELKFKSHIDNIIKKMAKKCGIICRLKKDLSVFAKIQHIWIFVRQFFLWLMQDKQQECKNCKTEQCELF